MNTSSRPIAFIPLMSGIKEKVYKRFCSDVKYSAPEFIENPSVLLNRKLFVQFKRYEWTVRFLWCPCKPKIIICETRKIFMAEYGHKMRALWLRNSHRIPLARFHAFYRFFSLPQLPHNYTLSLDKHEIINPLYDFNDGKFKINDRQKTLSMMTRKDIFYIYNLMALKAYYFKSLI